MGPFSRLLAALSDGPDPRRAEGKRYLSRPEITKFICTFSLDAAGRAIMRRLGTAAPIGPRYAKGSGSSKNYHTRNEQTISDALIRYRSHFALRRDLPAPAFINDWQHKASCQHQISQAILGFSVFPHPYS